MARPSRVFLVFLAFLAIAAAGALTLILTPDVRASLFGQPNRESEPDKPKGNVRGNL